MAPEPIQKALDEYPDIYTQTYTRLMSEKLGLEDEDVGDAELIRDLLQVLHDSRCDYTLFLRTLCDFPATETREKLQKLANHGALLPWLETYQARLNKNRMDDATRQRQMKQRNPKYILRNYLAQQAIEQAQDGHYGELEKLMSILQSPFEEHPDFAHYAAEPPPWGKKLEVSCSS